MAESGSEVQNYDDHKATYEGFISGCILTTLGSFFILVALIICGFSDSHYVVNLIVGLGGMFLGFVVLGVEAKAGSNYLTSLIFWILFALLAIFMVV